MMSCFSLLLHQKAFVQQKNILKLMYFSISLSRVSILFSIAMPKILIKFLEKSELTWLVNLDRLLN